MFVVFLLVRCFGSIFCVLGRVMKRGDCIVRCFYVVDVLVGSGRRDVLSSVLGFFEV